MSYGEQTHNPIEHDESPIEDEGIFQCACGDPECKGHDADPANINICGTFYAADCKMANHHPYVLAMRQRDHFNETRR